MGGREYILSRKDDNSISTITGRYWFQFQYYVLYPSSFHADVFLVLTHTATSLTDGKRRGRRLDGPPSAPEAVLLLHLISFGGGL